MAKLFYGFWLVLLMLNSLPVHGEMTLEELMNPETIQVSGQMIFITQGAEILCYDKRELKFVRKFGTRGQGPGEFDISPIDNLGLRLFLSGEKIVVNSSGKISFFTREGKLINEKRIQFSMLYFKAIGDKYVASRIGVMEGKRNRRSITVNLYDSNFKKEVQLQEVPHYVQASESVDPIALVLALKNQNHRTLVFQVTGDKIYVEGEQKDGINVFNPAGKRISTITYPFEKVKITEKFKDRIKSYLKKRLPNLYNTLRKLIKFPSYYPFIRSFLISDRMLYVRVHQASTDTGLFYIFSIAGKFIKHKSVPLKDVGVLRTYPYTISGKKIYQLVEDDEENWQLRVSHLLTENEDSLDYHNRQR